MGQRYRHFTLEDRRSSGSLAIEYYARNRPQHRAWRSRQYAPAYAEDIAWSRRWRLFLSRRKSKCGLPPHRHNPLKSLKNRVSIHQRPKSVMARKRFGHWEADLLHPQKSGPAILVGSERKSRYTLLVKLNGKHAEPVADQLTQWLAPPCPRTENDPSPRTMEPSSHVITNAGDINIKTFFCDPHKPWQKGSVENTNGRIRRFIPRGTDPNSFSNQDIQRLATLLNNTPRKCLGFNTPAEIFHGNKHVLHFKCESAFPPAREGQNKFTSIQGALNRLHISNHISAILRLFEATKTHLRARH